MTTTADNNTRVRRGHKKSKLTPELIEKMSGIMAQGHYFITACNACNIDKTTAYKWINQGELDLTNNVESLNTNLINSLKKAESDAEQALLAVVKEKAINGKEWIPAMTILERRHPERWGRKDRSLIQIDEHKTVTITNVEVIKDYGRGMMVEGEAKEILAPGDKD